MKYQKVIVMLMLLGILSMPTTVFASNSAADTDASAKPMQEKEVQMLSKNKLSAFFSSDVCRDILQAEQVYREFAFRLLLPARELYAVDSDEKILVQGVADLVYIKGSRAFIIDYKTDASADPEVLRQRYRPQLVVYKKAIEELLSVQVEKTVLYAISASSAIDL